MKVIIAIDSFKGTLTSVQACKTAQRAFKSVFPEVQAVIVPIADGGEGTAYAYYSAIGGRMVTTEVTSPEFTKVNASYAILPDHTAVIEMAEASGLTLVKGALNAGEATSYGTGELILDAIEKGCRHFIIGLGGSATNDGGVGALSALGIRFLNKNGIKIKPNGNGLSDLSSIDLNDICKEIAACSFTIACDVQNRICGEEGATFIYGGQKGVKNEDYKRLDDNLAHFAEMIEKTTGREILNIKGGGAAGGMCAGLMGFLNAKTESGIELLLQTIAFEEMISDADYIFSGEGRVDAQTAYGKVISGISAVTKKLQKPLIVIAGQLSDGYEAIFDSGVTAAFSTLHAVLPFEQIKHRAEQDLYDTMKNICNLLKTIDKV